jgi:hypothetical protein
MQEKGGREINRYAIAQQADNHVLSLDKFWPMLACLIALFFMHPRGRDQEMNGLYAVLLSAIDLEGEGVGGQAPLKCRARTNTSFSAPTHPLLLSP